MIEHWTCLHLVYIGTLTRNWTAYIKFIEEKVADIVSALPFRRIQTHLA
jgi:hypothetical protein